MDDPVIAEATGVAVTHRDKGDAVQELFDYTKSDQVKAAMEQAAADGFAADQPAEEIKAAIETARDEAKGA